MEEIPMIFTTWKCWVFILHPTRSPCGVYVTVCNCCKIDKLQRKICKNKTLLRPETKMLNIPVCMWLNEKTNTWKYRVYWCTHDISAGSTQPGRSCDDFCWSLPYNSHIKFSFCSYNNKSCLADEHFSCTEIYDFIYIYRLRHNERQVSVLGHLSKP